MNTQIPNFNRVPTKQGTGAPLNVGFDLLNTNFTDLHVIVQDIVLNKVNKVPGKDLSTNDYSDTDKAKVASLPVQVESVAGSQAKASVAETNSKLYVDELMDTKQDKLTPLDDTVIIDENNNIRVNLDLNNENLVTVFNNQLNF